MDEILASGLRRPAEDNLLLRQIPVGNDGSVLLTLLENRSPLLAALFLLGLGALRRDTGACLALGVLALGALLPEPERGVAEMALAVDAHADGFLNTKSMALGFMPLAGLQFQSIKLAKLLSTFLEDLSSRDLCGCWMLGNPGDSNRFRGGRWRAIFDTMSASYTSYTIWDEMRYQHNPSNDCTTGNGWRKKQDLPLAEISYGFSSGSRRARPAQSR